MSPYPRAATAAPGGPGDAEALRVKKGGSPHGSPQSSLGDQSRDIYIYIYIYMYMYMYVCIYIYIYISTPTLLLLYCYCYSLALLPTVTLAITIILPHLPHLLAD